MSSNGASAVCKLCGSVLSSEPIAELRQAPAGAQALPDASQVPTDQGVHLVIHECGWCGLVQHTAAPVPYFRDVITAASLSPEMLTHRREQFDHWAERYGLAGKSVIEVGCGTGGLLPVFRDIGMRPVGLEHGRAVGTQGPDSIPVISGYPAPGEVLEGAPFDAFVCVNFLEHAPDPRGFLCGIVENLTADGVGLVEVPSLEHVLETARGYDWVTDHVSYFSESTLRLMLELSGLIVDSVERTWKGYDLCASVRRRPRSGAEALGPALDEAAGGVRAFLASERASGRRVAVWGASHQALTLLAEADADGIAYVIDSAPFKQGRYTPVTHLPITAASALTERPVDTVLVMAAGYSDEVVSLLKEHHHFTGRVAVLRGNRMLEE